MVYTFSQTILFKCGFLISWVKLRDFKFPKLCNGPLLINALSNPLLFIIIFLKKKVNAHFFWSMCPSQLQAISITEIDGSASPVQKAIDANFLDSVLWESYTLLGQYFSCYMTSNFVVSDLEGGDATSLSWQGCFPWIYRSMRCLVDAFGRLVSSCIQRYKTSFHYILYFNVIFLRSWNIEILFFFVPSSG